MSVFLLYLNTAQKVDTVEHGMVRGLAIANPATCETRALARDYLAIEAGDHELVADRPVLLGGSALGPGPYSYLLAALGT